MDTARGQGRRPLPSSSTFRRDPGLDPSPDVEGKSPSGGDHDKIKGTHIKAASMVGGSDDSGSTRRTLVSPTGKSDEAVKLSTFSSSQESSLIRGRQNNVPAKTSSGDAANGSFEVAQCSLSTEKKVASFPERLKDHRTRTKSKTSEQASQSETSAKRCIPSMDLEMVSTGQSSSGVQNIFSVEPTAQNKYASMPIIRLSYGEKESPVDIDSYNGSLRTFFDKFKVTNKDRKITQQTKLIDKRARKATSSEKVRIKDVKSQSKHFSRDRGAHEKDTSFSGQGQGYSKSMQLLIPKTHHRKRDSTRKSESSDGAQAFVRAPLPSVLPPKRPSPLPKTPTSLKILQSLKKFTFGGKKSASLSPTQPRPRKKFSRGHISQDPLEVDYEILDDSVTSVVPRMSLPVLTEKPRPVPNSEHRKNSVEEPLLSKHSESEVKLDKPKSLRIPFMQTFPRTKHQRSEQYSSFLELSPSRRTPTSSLSETASHFISNQLQSPDSTFTTFHKSPSSTSSISAEVRSDVCIDLLDPGSHLDYDESHADFVDREVYDFRTILGFPSAPYDRIIHYTQHSVLMLVLSAICKAMLSIILVCPLLVLVIVVVPLVLLIKCLCNWFCCCRASFRDSCCFSTCHTHLTSSELLWLDQKAAGSATVQCLLVLQKGLDIDRIRSLIDSRLLSLENRRGHKVYSRFTQKVVQLSCGYVWVADDHFVLSAHVFNMPGYIETLEDLQHFIAKMATEPMPRDRPLWEIQVLHNFREPRDTVLLFRMHMCMADGVSLVHVLEDALVDSQKISHPQRSFSRQATNISSLWILLCGPVIFLSRYIFRQADYNSLHGAHVLPSGEMAIAWSEPYSLSAAMRLKQVARCTLGELFLSATAGSMRTYLQLAGVPHPHNMACLLPVDFREEHDDSPAVENNYSLVISQLPTNTEGNIPRLWEVKFLMAKFKSSAETAVVNDARWLTCCLLPVSCFQRLWLKIYSKCTLRVCNLAGPTCTLKVDSREVKCMMYWVPPLDSVPVTVSFITYADQVRMTVICDRSVIPNPDLLTRDFVSKLETLSRLLAHRRIPGDATNLTRQETTCSPLSSLTLDDLTAVQVQLEISLVEQELRDLKRQLNSSSTYRISQDDIQVMARIETLKERSRELLLHLRRRKAEEAESAIILSEEDNIDSDPGTDKQQKPFRRRTLSMSSKMSTVSVSSTARPLSTASASSAPSPIHTGLPSWPEGDQGIEELDRIMPSRFSGANSHGILEKHGDGSVSPISVLADKTLYENNVS